MNNLEVILTEVRDHLLGAAAAIDRALKAREDEYVCDLPGPQGELGADWPKVDLSHLSKRRAIQQWLELLPSKRTASPAEIKKGLKAARSGIVDKEDTIQQSIYELYKEGKIRREAWGEYGAVL